MKVYTEKELNDARRLQATLTAIDNKQKVFFNIAIFVDKGLVRYRNGWILTEKAKQFLNVQL